MMQELNYIRCGDYYIPDIRLPEENRPIGRWGRMHRDRFSRKGTRRCNLTYWRWAWDEAKHKSKRNIL